MKIYSYSPINGLFIKGSEREARENPRAKGQYLLPAGATFKKPPEEKECFAIKWNGAKEEWFYEELPRHYVDGEKKHYLGFLKKEDVPKSAIEVSVEPPDGQKIIWNEAKKEWQKDIKEVLVQKLMQIRQSKAQLINKPYKYPGHALKRSGEKTVNRDNKHFFTSDSETVAKIRDLFIVAIHLLGCDLNNDEDLNKVLDNYFPCLDENGDEVFVAITLNVVKNLFSKFTEGTDASLARRYMLKVREAYKFYKDSNLEELENLNVDL